MRRYRAFRRRVEDSTSASTSCREFSSSNRVGVEDKKVGRGRMASLKPTGYTCAMSTARPEELALLFTEARTHCAWSAAPVTDGLLRRLYELLRWPPPAARRRDPCSRAAVEQAGAAGGVPDS